jgi:aryl-alcohol dehydrogenase-like predicted oxidoreductase
MQYRTLGRTGVQVSSLVLARGFVTPHPAVTSAIVGPRTLDHLGAQLAAADTVLPADVLDAIDPSLRRR